MNSSMKATAAALVLLGAAGCSTWDGLSRAEKGAVIGAGVGGVAGNVVSGGSTLGTLGGAAVGGVVGHEVERRKR